MRHLVEFQDPNKALVYFIVDDEKFSRNHKTSFYWFMQRELKRAFPGGKSNWVEYSFTIKFCCTVKYNYEDVTAKVFDNLLDFYKEIGYDMHSKKYV